MELEALQAFFGWCTVINTVFYAVGLIANIGLRSFYTAMVVRMFQVSESEWHATLMRGVVTYKLLIVVFNFVPWLVLVIMTSGA